MQSKLVRPPSGDQVCQQCHSTCICNCSKLIRKCACPITSVLHESCLQTQIQKKMASGSQEITPSYEHPEIMKYKCRQCEKEIFFNKDYDTSCIPISQWTCLEIVVFNIFAISIGSVGIFAGFFLSLVVGLEQGEKYYNVSLLFILPFVVISLIIALILLVFCCRLFRVKFYVNEIGEMIETERHLS